MLFSRANRHNRLDHVLKVSKAWAVKGYRRCGVGKQRKSAQEEHEARVVLDNPDLTAADPSSDSLCAVLKDSLKKDQSQKVIKSGHQPTGTKKESNLPGSAEGDSAENTKKYAAEIDPYIGHDTGNFTPLIRRV